MNFDPNKLGINLNNFGDSQKDIAERNKKLVSLLVKASTSTLKELLCKVGLTTVGSKQELRLRLCRYFSQNIENADKDPNFSGTYFTSKSTQEELESIIAKDTSEASDDENLEEVKETTIDTIVKDLENKLVILNNTSDATASSSPTNSCSPIIKSNTDTTILEESPTSGISAISPDYVNKLFNTTSTAIEIVNTLLTRQKSRRNTLSSTPSQATQSTQIQSNTDDQHNNRIKMTPKINLSKFSGKPTEDLQEFINLFNKFSRLNQWGVDDKVDYITFYLEGAALVSLQSFLGNGNKTWDEIEEHLKDRFGQNKTLDYSVELQYLKLGPQNPIEVYTHKIEKYCDALNLSEEMKVINLIKGLPVSMIDKMDVLDNSTFQKAIHNIKKIQLGKKIQDERIRSSVLENTHAKAEPENQEVKALSKQIENLSVQIQAIQKSQTRPQHQKRGPPRSGFQNPRGYSNQSFRGYYQNSPNQNYHSRNRNSYTSYRPNNYHTNTNHNNYNNHNNQNNPNNNSYYHAPQYTPFQGYTPYQGNTSHRQNMFYNQNQQPPTRKND